MKQKCVEGSVALLYVQWPGQINMGPSLLQWFVFLLVVSLFVGYIASRAGAADVPPRCNAGTGVDLPAGSPPGVLPDGCLRYGAPLPALAPAVENAPRASSGDRAVPRAPLLGSLRAL